MFLFVGSNCHLACIRFYSALKCRGLSHFIHSPTLLFYQHNLNYITRLNECMEKGNLWFIVEFTVLKIAM